MKVTEKIEKALQLLEEVNDLCFQNDTIPTDKSAEGFKSLLRDSIHYLGVIQSDGYYEEFANNVDKSHPYYHLFKQEIRELDEEFAKELAIHQSLQKKQIY
jgi:hypothetical protein